MVSRSVGLSGELEQPIHARLSVNHATPALELCARHSRVRDLFQPPSVVAHFILPIVQLCHGARFDCSPVL